MLLKYTGMNSSGKAVIEVVLSDYKTVGAESSDGYTDIQMMELNMGGDLKMYVTSVQDVQGSATVFQTKTMCQEKENMVLYFTIKINSLDASS